MPLNLLLNGHERIFDDLDSGASLQDLVASLGLKGDRIAVERNGEIAPRTGWAEVILVPGDRIELVHFVGGGIA